jgi:hypothetical protein
MFGSHRVGTYYSTSFVGVFENHKAWALTSMLYVVQHDVHPLLVSKGCVM